FRMPRSSWADYNAKLISRGGGVFPRSAKSISLSSEVRRVLGISAQALTPNELISAILKAPVDLLYNGGIGTYVKSTRQSHADVGDRANDAIRVNGADLRCKVVAEGGNLGFTQLGRIEFALAGGRINTDAIDNSAGVSCSDHEVNIKILLNAPVREGKLTYEQRNKLLADMTDEVAALVLRDNYFQTQSLAVSGVLAPSLLDSQERFIRSLEKAGRLNRALEFLPNDEEFAERRAAKIGLTAPERAVLLAYSKIALKEELVGSNVPDDPFISTALERYFPVPLRERYRTQIHAHPLRREIIATHVTNSMINRVGSTFVHRLQDETGAAAPDVVRAYLITREAFGLVELWQAVEALDYKVPDRIQTAMVIDAGRLILRASLWFLRNRSHLADLSRSIEHFRAGAKRVAALFPQVLPDAEQTAFQAAASRLEKEGVPRELAARIAATPSTSSKSPTSSSATSSPSRAFTSPSPATSTSRGCARTSACSPPTTTGKPSPRPPCATTWLACSAPSAPMPCAPAPRPPSPLPLSLSGSLATPFCTSASARSSPIFAPLSQPISRCSQWRCASCAISARADSRLLGLMGLACRRMGQSSVLELR
ncbi:MAG: NAD-glutamate dehydrogenase, partial [Betaproteobacteria bacterium]